MHCHALHASACRHCCEYLLMSLGHRSQESIEHLGAACRPAFDMTATVAASKVP